MSALLLVIAIHAREAENCSLHEARCVAQAVLRPASLSDHEVKGSIDLLCLDCAYLTTYLYTYCVEPDLHFHLQSSWLRTSIHQPWARL